MQNKTFNSSNLYNLFKPKNNPDLITSFEVIVGGTALTADLNKGAIVLNLVSSTPITLQFKDFKHLILKYDKENVEGYINEYSLLENTYQVDIYKVNSPNANVIEVEVEALKIREWLNSFESIEYLQSFDSAMLPCYSNINYTSELLQNHFVNRAFFEFKIITKNVINEQVGLIEKAFIENQLILGN